MTFALTTRSLRNIAAAMLLGVAAMSASVAPSVAQGQPAPPKQVALTDAHIKQMIDVKGVLDAIDAKYGNDKSEAADKKAMAEAEAAVQKAGFKGGLNEFDNIAFSVGVVLGSLDDNNTLMSKEQIIARTTKEIEAANMPAAEKAKAMADMKRGIGEMEAPMPANVEIVKKQAAKLREMMQ
jgi:opacity protein-like surface antigen